MECDSLDAIARKNLAGLARLGMKELLTEGERHLVPLVTPAVSDIPSSLRAVRRWMTTAEVANILQCHEETVYHRIKHQGLPAARDSGRWKFDPSLIADWIRDRPSSRGATGHRHNGNGACE